MIAAELAFRPSGGPLVRDISKRRTAEIAPLPGWNFENSNIKFVIAANSQEMISSVFILYFVFTILHSDGSPLDPAEETAFLSYPAASFFESVRLTLNGRIVSGQNQNWPVRTWVQSLLTLSSTAKASYARDLYRIIPDSPFKAQVLNDAENAGETCEMWVKWTRN